MPVLPIPQHSDWSDNIYVLTATRVLVIIGAAYLIRTLYSLVPSIWGTSSASVAVAVEEGIGLDNIISDTSVTLPGSGGTSPDLNANLAVEVRPPPRSYDRHGRTEGSRSSTRAQDESTEVPASSTTSHTVPEQDIGVHNGDPDTEEGQVDFARLLAQEVGISKDSRRWNSDSRTVKLGINE
ncbi:hypothetical protein BDR22DRAFT_826351 [Usnea florida]